jgi:ABC-2 type transport system permease protein
VVAQFLRLKLRLLANLFRRSPWQVVGIEIGLVYGLGLAAVIVGVLVSLRLVDDIPLVRDGMIVTGAAVVLAFVVFPLVLGVDDTMDPRKFALLGIPNKQLSLGLALSALIGVPAIVLTLALAGTIVTWSRGPGETLLALVSALLILPTCVLASRVSTSVAALLLSTRRSREFAGLIGVLLLVFLAPVAVLLFNFDWGRNGERLLGRLADTLGWTPLGAGWAVPGDASNGDWGAALLKLLIAAATLYLLWLAWQGLVAKMLVTPGREAPVKQYAGLGWFDRMPSNPTGAIAARSITYWWRDSRYWVSLVMIPVVPVLVLTPLAVAGVPSHFLSLLPVPLMCIFLGWTIHNDVAFDSTAIWLHIASGTRGIADRVGRMVPALFTGILVIGLGSVVSVYFYGDWAVLPSVLGVSTSILLAALGFSSYTSARFPYPAPKPGDSPFAQPQGTDTAAALVQSVSFLGSILLSLPAIGFALLGIFVDPVWHLPALYAGVGMGVLSVAGGLWLGSRVFNRRGPEIIASALRA